MTRLSALILAAALGLVAACGGGDDSVTESVTTPSATTAPASTAPAEPTTSTTAPTPIATPDLPGLDAGDAAVVSGYPGWTELTRAPAPELAALGSGAHPGDKRVWASPARDELGDGAQRFPYPAGTVVVKEVRSGDAITLIAIMEKVRANDEATGGWRYVEYKRSDGSADFAKVGFPESGCAGCHAGANATDWVFYSLP